MIYERKYVKALIRKKVLGRLSAREWAEYQASQRIYTDEEFDDMFAETLLEMRAELPADPLKGWRPDFKSIYAGDNPVQTHKRRRGSFQIAAAAVLVFALIGIGIYMYHVRQQTGIFLYGACADWTLNAEVPLTESNTTLYWDDTARMQVGKEQQGELLRYGEINISRTAEGVLMLETAQSTDTEAKEGVIVATGAREQAVVELPDGTLVRLNAQSALRYAPEEPEISRLVVYGEAYIQRPKKTSDIPLIFSTKNGFVKSFNGDFALLTRGSGTRAATFSGRLTLHAYTGNDQLLLDCNGAIGYLTRLLDAERMTVTDSLRYEVASDTKALLMWTQAVRTYKEVPLREFVAQMSQWYGFKVENYNCIPADRRITTTICYKQGINDIYAAIQHAGVLLYENQGMISFCPQEETQSSPIAKEALAWKE